MPYDIRPIGADELEDFTRVDHQAFGYHLKPEAVERQRLAFELDRSLATFDGDRLVGTAGAFSFQLTLPGLTTVPVAAVSFVGVLPTHRRRGVLSGMMRCQLEDVRSRGEALAVLTASEGGIYGRFGYGLASFSASYQIERTGSTLNDAARALDTGSVRMLDAVGARSEFPSIQDAWRRRQPGELAPTAGFWDDLVLEDLWNETRGSRFMAVHEGPDGPDAYADYYVDRDWEGTLARSRVQVHALTAATPAAEVAMFSFLCGIDLVREIHLANRPLDDPLRWSLADPRQLRTEHVADWLWVRPVDAAAALAARRYRVTDRMVLDLTDEWLPENTGRLEVAGGPDGAQAGPAGGAGPADLALGASELGSILLGGVTPSALARAGRIEELRAGALQRADLFFGTNRPPWCATEF